MLLFIIQTEVRGENFFEIPRSRPGNDVRHAWSGLSSGARISRLKVIRNADEFKKISANQQIPVTKLIFSGCKDGNDLGHPSGSALR
jgi:hypothetical protein